MLEFLRGKASDRKLRLFAVACGRRVYHLVSEAEDRNAIEVAERFADGDATDEELAAVAEAADTTEDGGFGIARPDAFAVALTAAYRTAIHAGNAAANNTTPNKADLVWKTVRSAERAIHPSLLRCVIGNPFRPVPVDPSWSTSSVTALAQAIYTERAFDRMPILADALEHTGCTSQDILSHCRSGGEHVRGCWVADLLLGKE